MKSIRYDDYEDFAYYVIDTLDEITASDDCNDISIIAKYKSANQILKELLCLECDIASVELSIEEVQDYCAEYILSITKINNYYQVWCEKFKREKGYISDVSTVTYIMDDCSSKVIPNVKSKIQFEVSIAEDDDEGNCTDCECKSDCKEYSGTDEDGNTFNISIKGDLDLDEAYAKLDEMEVRMLHMSEMFDEMKNFSKLLGFRI